MNEILKGIFSYQSGFLFVAVICLLSWCVAMLDFFTVYRISVLIVAIFLGIMFSAIYAKYQSHFEKGVNFSAKKLLRVGVVLYGFNVSFAEIALVGFEGIMLSLCIVASILIIGFLVGTKILKIDKDLALLVSGGSAICGAAAILAIESVIKSEPYKSVIAVGGVVIFGLIGMFLYPFLYILLDGYLSEQQMGIYMGAVLHEVANVVGAGSAVGDEAQRLAVIVKMIRVIMLVPVLLIISFLLPKHSSSGYSLSIPWFAFAFLAVVGINSIGFLPDFIIDIFQLLCLMCLSMAMVALGLQIDLKKFIQVGAQAFVLALLLFVLLMVIGFLGTMIISR